jgi:hypothetical protein
MFNFFRGDRVILSRIDGVSAAPELHLMAHVRGDTAIEWLEGSIVSGTVIQIVHLIELG